MLKSMTGFGRAIVDAPFGRLTVEIQSVNRKYLEIFVSMPKEFSRFELEIRKWISAEISRGSVTVRIFLDPKEGALLPDVAVLKGMKKGWEKIAKELKVSAKAIDLPFLIQYLPNCSREAKEEDLKPFSECVKGALRSLLKMKQAEGKALAQDFSKRVKELERLIGAVEKHAPDATEKMKLKLFEKIKEVSGDVEDRLLREVALFAERVDISEEITRFHSHIGQFKGLVEEEGVGRKMDFLIQEMGREINTIGSKSMEAKISHLVVNLKSELEKMREQIQNVE